MKKLLLIIMFLFPCFAFAGPPCIPPTIGTIPGLGTIVTQDANAVAITGGTITGITDLTVANGGTGVSTLADGGLVIGNGTATVEVVAAGALTEILVGGGTATNPVWTTATGTGAPVRATSPTLTGTPLTSAPSDNTSTTQIATTAFAKSEDAVLKREPDQAVNMTAAASASSGIIVADNDNIDFGTGNFTLVWKGSFPDWTPSVVQGFFVKEHPGQSNFIFAYIDITGGRLALEIENTTIRYSSIGNSFSDRTNHEITIVVIRETASVAGSVTYYVDGVQFGTVVVIPIGAPPSISSDDDMYILGNANNRTAGICSFVATYNRALAASEVLDLYRNGVNFADKDGSQTTLTSGTLIVGKRYRIVNWITNDDFTNIGGTNVNGTEFIATGTTPTTWTNSSTVLPIGSTLRLEPEGIQIDKWYDSSSNGLSATYPTVGWNLTRQPSKKRIKQPTPTAETTVVTLTIAKLLTGIITATHTAGTTQAYTLPTGVLCDAWPAFGINDYFDWVLINLSAAALDTVTVTADTGHTFVGNPIVQSANAATGGVMGNSAMFRTRKISANVFETYRISG